MTAAYRNKYNTVQLKQSGLRLECNPGTCVAHAQTGGQQLKTMTWRTRQARLVDATTQYLQQVVKVIWQKGRIATAMNGSVIFASWRPCAQCTPFNTCFLGSTWVHTSNGTSIDRFSRFCKAHYCDSQTDRQTDRPTDHHASLSVTIGRIYVVLRCGLKFFECWRSMFEVNASKASQWDNITVRALRVT